jgi:hypothetical protein
MRDFNADNSEKFVFLLSTRAGGLVSHAQMSGPRRLVVTARKASFLIWVRLKFTYCGLDSFVRPLRRAST